MGDCYLVSSPFFSFWVNWCWRWSASVVLIEMAWFLAFGLGCGCRCLLVLVLALVPRDGATVDAHKTTKKDGTGEPALVAWGFGLWGGRSRWN